jgi:hypothetical protein
MWMSVSAPPLPNTTSDTLLLAAMESFPSAESLPPTIVALVKANTLKESAPSLPNSKPLCNPAEKLSLPRPP